MYGLSPVWDLLWPLKSPLLEKDLWRILQVKGFSPMWVPTWRFKYSAFSNVLWHSSHVYVFSQCEIFHSGVRLSREVKRWFITLITSLVCLPKWILRSSSFWNAFLHFSQVYFFLLAHKWDWSFDLFCTNVKKLENYFFLLTLANSPAMWALHHLFHLILPVDYIF